MKYYELAALGSAHEQAGRVGSQRSQLPEESRKLSEVKILEIGSFFKLLFCH